MNNECNEVNSTEEGHICRPPPPEELGLSGDYDYFLAVSLTAFEWAALGAVDGMCSRGWLACEGRHEQRKEEKGEKGESGEKRTEVAKRGKRE